MSAVGVRGSLPCNEENSALLNILCSHKIKIINSIAALVSWEACGKIFIALGRLAKLLHNNLLLLFLNLINYEAVSSFSLQLQKLQLAVIMHSHTRCCVGLHTHTVKLHTVRQEGKEYKRHSGNSFLMVPNSRAPPSIIIPSISSYHTSRCGFYIYRIN